MTQERKTVLITGCTSPGIGYHLAQAFKDHGYHVFATARNEESIVALQDYGIEILSLTVDDEESVRACYARVKKLLNGRGLDLLINNAGRNYTMPAVDLDMSEVHQTFASNLYGVMQINKAFIPLVLAQRGTLVHVGSVAGAMPYLFSSTYNASKAALHAYCNTLRVELAPYGVQVLTLITGGVKSNLTRTPRQLPQGSLFMQYQPQFQRRLGHSLEGSMETREYAEQVVKECHNARGWLWNRSEVWMGAKAGRVWWLDLVDRFWPGGIWTHVMQIMFNFRPQGKDK